MPIKKTVTAIAASFIYTSCFTLQILSLNNTTKEVLNLVKNLLPDNPTILEAGAFNGEDTVILSSYWPNGKIYAFEPVPTIYQWLQDKTKKLSNVYTFNKALSSSNGSTNFYLSLDNFNNPFQSGSLLAPKEHLAYSPVVFNGTIEVETQTIDQWAKENGILSIDFLWLDMQGVELNTLKASPEIVKTVKAIYTEVEFIEAYEGQYLYEHVKDWLEQEGFTIIAQNFPINRPKEIWFGDILAVRK